MIMSTLNLERQADALARAQKHWQTEAKTAWTVALTREAGTDGSPIAQEVARRLNWTVYDRELIEHIAREMGLRSTLLDSIDEKQRSWLLECVDSLSAAGAVSEPKFVKHLVETLLSLSAHGNCVIVGRGAAHVLPAASTLRVRLVGDRHDRVKKVQERQHLTETEAARWVEQTDRERAHFVKQHFFKDPMDPAAYDLVLNTSRWSKEECAELIVDAIAKLKQRA
jgi:cytidylate kinase